MIWHLSSAEPAFDARSSLNGVFDRASITKETELDSEYYNWEVSLGFETSDCSSKPVLAYALHSNCDASADTIYYTACYQNTLQKTSSLQALASVVRFTHNCTDDIVGYLSESFNETESVWIDVYQYQNCSGWHYMEVHATDGECHSDLGIDADNSTYVLSSIATFQDNGSIVYQEFDSADCSGEVKGDYDFSSSQLVSGECTERLIASTNAGSGSVSGQDASSSSPSFTRGVEVVVGMALLSMSLVQ